MAVTTQRPEEKSKPSTADHVVSAVRDVAHALHEQRLFKSAARDAIAEGLHGARLGARRAIRTLENATDDAVLRVRRRPFRALTGVFAVGLALGVVLGWVTKRRPREER